MCGRKIRREFILDGNKFSDMAGFYCEVEKLFTKDLDWKIGRNLNAFNDILRGGFGVHDDEPIHIIWKNFSKSREHLGCKVTKTVIGIILDTDNSLHDCTLEIME